MVRFQEGFGGWKCPFLDGYQQYWYPLGVKTPLAVWSTQGVGITDTLKVCYNTGLELSSWHSQCPQAESFNDLNPMEPLLRAWVKSGFCFWSP